METMKDDNMKPRAGSPELRAQSPEPKAQSPEPVDFGPDADVVPPGDPAFDAWIRQAAPTLNAPNAAPRAEMWEAIQAAQKTAQDAQSGQLPGVTPLRRAPWRLMSVIAAAVLLGVVVDRFALRGVERTSVPVASVPSPSRDTSDPSRLYRMAAAQTLTQAEALLTAYRASDTPRENSVEAQQLGTWGRQVLGSTRLLIDSPAGDDPQLRALLNDLELVLVQIIQLSGGELDPGDRALIDRALQDRDLLPRIRTAVPAGVPAGPVSDD
jgi:hypothetical protein